MLIIFPDIIVFAGRAGIRGLKGRLCITQNLLARLNVCSTGL